MRYNVAFDPFYLFVSFDDCGLVIVLEDLVWSKGNVSRLIFDFWYFYNYSDVIFDLGIAFNMSHYSIVFIFVHVLHESR